LDEIFSHLRLPLLSRKKREIVTRQKYRAGYPDQPAASHGLQDVVSFQSLANYGRGLVKMLDQQPAREIGIAIERRLDNGDVLDIEQRVLGGGDLYQMPVTQRLLAKELTELHEPARPAAADQGLMELSMPSLPFLGEFVRTVLGLPFLYLRHVVTSGNYPNFPFVVPFPYRPPQRPSLEHFEAFKNIDQIVDRHRRDPKSSLALQLDEGVGSEAGQGLAQRANARTVSLSQLLET
jgi:hypothetical protein